MARKSPPKKQRTAKEDDAAQSKRFRETAREIGADEKPEAFEKAFKRVTAKRKPN